MVLWLLGAAMLARAAGFYLPGLAPVSFCEPERDQVPDCKVNMTCHLYDHQVPSQGNGTTNVECTRLTSRQEVLEFVG